MSVIGPAAEHVVKRLKFPRLLVLVACLFVADLFIPDCIPYFDEIFLALLTALLASWRVRRVERPPADPGSP